MRAHLFVPAVAAFLGIGAGGAAIYLQTAAAPAPPPIPPNALAPAPPRPSAFAWWLTAASSAHRAMVLEVETTRPAEAVAIAQQLTEPYKDRYDEVLVFFFEPNLNPRLASVRVQWTRARGYRTLTLRDAQRSSAASRE